MKYDLQQAGLRDALKKFPQLARELQESEGLDWRTEPKEQRLCLPYQSTPLASTERWKL